MAKQPTRSEPSDDITEAPDEPSSLEESTHAELLMMYNECATSIRFAKSQQWQSMGGVLLLFTVLSIYAGFTADSPWALKSVLVLSILASVGGIYALMIYQFWQATEREKLIYISARLSSTFRQVRGFTNPRESNFQRYLLLFFMVFCIVAGNWLLVLFVTPKLQVLTQ
jgi:hypothetical protein